MKQTVGLLCVLLLLALSPFAQAAPVAQGNDYIVQADDWLSKLADKFLGDVLAYPAITYHTNQKHSEDSSYAQIIDSDVIEAGQKIYIPTEAEAAAYFDSVTENLGQDGLKIGALAPLSAPGSVSAGTAMKTAFEIALEEINEAGGLLEQPVELVLLDTEGLPERGAAAMTRLIVEEGVVGVVGEYHSPVALAAKAVAVEAMMPTIFVEPWNDNLTADQAPSIFRLAPLASEVAALEINAIEALAADYVVIVTEAGGYGVPFAEDGVEQLTARAIEAEIVTAAPGTLDFSGLIERIKAGRPPAVIWVLLTGQTAYTFQQQAAEAGLGPQDVTMICAQDAANSEAFWSAVPDGNLCLYRRIALPRQSWSEATDAFAAAYAAETGKPEPELVAMAAYDALKLMAQAIEAAGATDPEAIISALENISYDGALGTITFPYGIDSPPPGDVAPKWWHQYPNPPLTLVQYQEPGQADSEAVVVYPETYQTGAIRLPPGGE